ncbi:hypothetical protein FQN57_002461 [Myotisia sp. PD_48]|nr:hypothetical protein FQN57_002461 [Myotisia sp. PD_48]
MQDQQEKPYSTHSIPQSQVISLTNCNDPGSNNSSTGQHPSALNSLCLQVLHINLRLQEFKSAVHASPPQAKSNLCNHHCQALRASFLPALEQFQAPTQGQTQIGEAPTSPQLNHSRPPSLFLQLETRSITEAQLITEVQSIYAGLVMVEKKCIEIDGEQLGSSNILTNKQWEALINLHRTFLYENYDFFLVSQHPSSTDRLRKLASKYAMPARMWKHGIYSFLELLHQRLPQSLDHMLYYIYTSYSIMTLLLESVPTFANTWVKCLGDLAKYRMAIGEADHQDRETWAGIAAYWDNKAADTSPMTALAFQPCD